MYVIEVQNMVDRTWRPAFGTRAERAGLKIASDNGEWLRRTIMPVFKAVDKHHEYRVVEYGPTDTRGSDI